MTTILDFIRTIPDYPKKGVNFYDLNSLFSRGIWIDYIKDLASDSEKTFDNITNIIGIESRGFVVGAALAYSLGLPFTMVRKKGSKYPGKLYEESYELEYGTDTLVLQQGILNNKSRVLLVDDLIATGGSIQATDRLVQQSNAEVLGYATILNLTYLNNLQNVLSLKEIN
jgi:adenine phosphoribosyltransferase